MFKIDKMLMKLMCITMLITAFYPYLTFYSFGTDIQPWNCLVVLLFVFVLLYFNTKISIFISILLLPLLMSLLLLLNSQDSFSAARSVCGYINIGLSPIVYYYILKNDNDLFVRMLKKAIIVWFVIGVIQLFVDPSFGSVILPRITTSIDRGVTSLAPEPTFYGIVCFFLLFIVEILDIQYKSRYIILLLIQIIAIAQSTMVILFLCIYLFYLFIFNINVKALFCIIALAFICSIVMINFDVSNSNIRVINLVNRLLFSGENMLYVDGSINSRASAIFFSVKGFFDNYMLPNGAGSYSTYLVEATSSNDFFWNVTISNRIMSFYGSILFELGFVGLLIPCVISLLIVKAYRYERKKMLVNLFNVNTILWSAIQLSFPLIGVVIAALIYRGRHCCPRYRMNTARP